MGAQVDVCRNAPQDRRRPAREDPLRGVDPARRAFLLGAATRLLGSSVGRLDRACEQGKRGIAGASAAASIGARSGEHRRCCRLPPERAELASGSVRRRSAAGGIELATLGGASGAVAGRLACTWSGSGRSSSIECLLYGAELAREEGQAAVRVAVGARFSTGAFSPAVSSVSRTVLPSPARAASW